MKIQRGKTMRSKKNRFWVSILLLFISCEGVPILGEQFATIYDRVEKNKSCVFSCQDAREGGDILLAKGCEEVFNLIQGG